LGALYFALMSGHLHSIDGLLAYRQGESLTYEHSILFGEPLWWGQTWTTSKYGIGLSLLYLPGLLLGSWLRPFTPVPSSQTYDWSLLYADPYYAWAGAPVHIIVTVLAAYLVALVCMEMGLGRTASLWALALYGVGSPALIYARGDWSQQLEGLCWIAAIYGALRFRRAEKLGAAICAIALAYAVLTRPVEGLLISGVTLLLMAPSVEWRKWSSGERRGIALAGVGCAVGIGITLLVNWARYGSPLDFGYGNEGWTTPLWVGLTGSLISPPRGILWEFPAVLLVPAGLRWLAQTGRRRVAVLLAALVISQLVNVSAWLWWWGGWNYGLRLFVPALPVLAVLAGCGLATLQGTAQRAVPLLLIAGGLLFSIPCVLTDLLAGYGATYNGTAESFRLDGYPLLSAPSYLHHLFASGAFDMSSIDILWVRLARETGGLSLVPMALLLILALVLAWRGVEASRQWAVKLSM
jgi:hypothetical protein